MPSLILSNPLGSDDAQEIGLIPREYAVGEVITVDDYVFATLIRTGYGKPYGSAEKILLVGDGDPSDALGVDGQWYLDLQTETLWGPKTGGYWPADPIRPDRGVSSWRIDENDHLIVTYSTGTVADLGSIRGPKGDAATVTINEVVTVPKGTPASVVNVGDEHAAVLDFALPQGEDGEQGPPGQGYGGGLVVGGVDISGELVTTITSNWGLRADGSTYFDPDGALPDEAALLVPDAEIGGFTLFRPGAPTLTLTAERVRDIVLDPDGPVMAELVTLFASESTLTTAVADLNTAIAARVRIAQIGQAGGVAGLDGSGKIPLSQLPSGIPTDGGGGGGGGDVGYVDLAPIVAGQPLDITIVSNWGISDILTNLVRNPQPTTGTTSWFGNAGTGGTATSSRPAAGGPTDGGHFRLTWTVAGTTAAGADPLASIVVDGRGSAAYPMPVTPSKAYSAAIYGRASIAQRMDCRIQWYDAANVLLSTVAGTAQTPGANTWTRLTITNATAPAGAAYARVTLGVPAGAGAVPFPIGATFDAALAQLEQATTVHEYFDGTTSGSSWTGTAPASTSTGASQTYYDDAGAPAEEAGLLIPDPETGSMAVWRPGAVWDDYLDQRIADRVIDPTSQTRAAIIALSGSGGGGGASTDRGSGAALPTTTLVRGQVFEHTGLSCLFIYTGSAWRQASVPTVATVAALRALPTTDVHDGFQVAITDANTSDAVRQNGKWHYQRWGTWSGTASSDLVPGRIVFAHGGGVAPVYWTCQRGAQTGTDADAYNVNSWAYPHTQDATNLTVRGVRFDAINYMAAEPLSGIWEARFQA